MFDATKLLGALMQHRSAPSAGSRLDAAAQRGAGGGLGDLLSQLGGGQGGGGLGSLLGGLMGGGAGGGQGGTLGGLAEMAKRAVNAPGQELQRNNPAAVGGLGALAGALLGGGRGAVGGGLMAVLGSLAYSALQGQNQGATATAAALPGYDDPAEVQRKALLMLRAMIQAAKSDGQIDAREMERITSRLDEAGEDREARDFVLQQLRGPVDIDALARDVTSQQDAAEVYAASFMAIEVDTDAERDYLARLATALNLPREAVERIHASLNVPA